MVNVSAQSFERAMHNEATKSRRVTAPAGTRECKQPSAPGEVPVKVLSDRGSTPLTSTKNTVSAVWLGLYFSYGVRGVESLSHTPGACAFTSAHTGEYLYFFFAFHASGKEMHAAPLTSTRIGLLF